MVTSGDSILRVSYDGGGDSRVVDLRWGRRKGTVGLGFFFLFPFYLIKNESLVNLNIKLMMWYPLPNMSRQFVKV